MINKLKGSSGVNISFRKSGRFKIVRKQSVKKEQIERLETQYEKHLFLLKQRNNLFHIPEILNQDFDENGLFFYEYRYIEGKEMTKIFLEKSNKSLLSLIDNLLAITKYFSWQKKFYEVSHINIKFKDILYEKIISNSDHLEINLKINFLNIFKKLEFPDEKTMCHGDLTFENIIVDKKNRIWLIDCIGTFYPHFWLDISTLFQDIEGEWSSIKYGIKLEREKSKYFTNYLKQNISFLDKNYLKMHNFLMALKFLRILPYLKNKFKREKVLKKISSYLNELNEN